MVVYAARCAQARQGAYRLLALAARQAWGLEELPRMEKEGAPVSASRVRALLAQGEMEQVRRLVPATTYAYLVSPKAQPVLERLRQRVQNGL